MFPCSIEIRDKLSASGQVVSYLGKQSVTFHIFSNGHVGKASNLPLAYEAMWRRAICGIKFAHPLQQELWIRGVTHRD
jgi:hypothetical protein